MIKKIVAGVCLLLSTVAFSQQNNASPYSYYGIGDEKFKGTSENRAMGGLGIVPDSIHINLQNPATYASLKWTTFTLGGTNTRTTFKSSSEEEKAQRSTLDYIAVAIPINKLGFAFGLMPYSSVGYRIENTTYDPVGDFNTFRRFNGNGGVNRFFAGAAYKVTPKLSVGGEFQYNFGQVETKSISNIDPGLQYSTRELNNTDYGGASFNFGATYQTRVGSKYEWITSATFAPQATLSSSTERSLAMVTVTRNGEIVQDELDQSIVDDEVKLPSKFTFGSGFGEARKWFVGAEYTFKESNELGNRFDDVTDAGFETAHKFSLGGYFIPKYTSFNSYVSRITYRAGLRYEKTGLVINGQSINDMGLSLGIGLPLNGVGGSNLNIGAEYGQRGTTSANLIKENYVNIFVSLSINDRWFVKRRYD